LNGDKTMIAAYSLFFRLLSAIATAGDTPPPVPSEIPVHRAVLRVSETMLNSLMGNQEVNLATEVRDVILGTAIYGRAQVVAKSGVKLADNPDQATFDIVFDGVAYSRTTGYNGPAIIYSRSVTKFSATRQIVFEPGKGFQGLAPRVTARTETYIDGIGSSRGGVIGRIVRRRAAKIAAARHSEATEIARQKAERRIAAAFERNSEQRISRLNWIATLRSLAMAALRTSGSGEPRYACCTTPHYLQIATGIGESSSPIDLPTSPAADSQGAPIEIWVHQSLIGEGAAVALDLLGEQIKASDLVKLITATASALGGGPDTSSNLQSLFGEQQVRTYKVGSWRVVELDMRSDEAQPVAQAQALRATVNSSRAIVEPAAVPQQQETPLVRPHHRIWTSGNYTADAEFLSLDGNIVRLRRTTGVGTSIPLEKLSVVDQQWIQAYLAGR
jgi:SLA1 homology domain 1, SHD1